LPSFSTEVINETWTGQPKLARDYAERDCSRKHAQKVDKVFHSDTFDTFAKATIFALLILEASLLSVSHTRSRQGHLCACGSKPILAAREES
jgi:hypothetical protein